MRKFLGEISNLEKEIIVIATFRKKIYNKNKYVYISKNGESPKGYAAIIHSNKRNCKITKTPTVALNDVDEIYEGDILHLIPEGEINVVFEKNSKHNSIFVTELCNHKCIMCPQPPVLREDDKTEFNLTLISLMDKQTKEIGITGGEPLLNKKNIILLLKKIKSKLPNTAVSILTNGVALQNKEFIKEIIECGIKDLQIDIPIFSDIDNLHNEIVGANTFYKTISGLYNLALYKQRIGIRIVVHKQTFERLPQFARFVYRNFPFVSNIAFMQMEVMGYAKDNFSSLQIDPLDYMDKLKEAVLFLDNAGMQVSLYNFQLCLLPFEIREFAKQSISEWKNIYIEECDYCSQKEYCAGFFASNLKNISTGIHVI